MRLPALWPLAWRAGRARWPALLTVGLLVLITSFLVDAGTRSMVAAYDRAARAAVADAPSGATALVVSSSLRAIAPADEESRGKLQVANTAGLSTLEARWRAAFPEALRDTVGTSDTFAGTDFMPLGKYSQLALGFSSTAPGHVRYVTGRPPGAPEHVGSGLRFQAALPTRAAERLGVKAGDVVTTAGQSPLSVRITGLFSPVDAGSAYWPTHHRFEDAEQERAKDGDAIFLATALLSPDGYQALCGNTPLEIDVAWTYTPDTNRFTAGTAPAIATAVHQAAESVSSIVVFGTGVTMSSRLDSVLEDYLHRLRATQTLLSLALMGGFAAALAVLILAARTLLGQLRTAMVTQAARGGSRTQLAGLTALLVGLVTLPAAVLGLALSALFVHGPAQGLSYAAAAILVVTAVGTSAVIAHHIAGHRATEGRGPTLVSRRRLAIEAMVVVLALAGTYVLRHRGLTTATSATGIDPFLSAVPTLVTVATGLLVLRLLPYPLRLAGRILGRGRSTAPFVGVARASRQGVAAVLPLVVLVLAVALIGFGSTVEASLDRAQRLATWQSVGGDARVDTLNINPALIDRVRRTPGVRAVVPAQTMDAVSLTSQGTAVDEVTVIGIDLAAYRRVMAGTPLRLPAPPSRTGTGVPALFSPAAAADTKAGQLGLSTNYGAPIALRNAGTIQGFPTETAGAKFVVVPADALARATGGTGTGSIFIRGDHLDAAALRRGAAQPALGASDAVVVAVWQATRDALAQGALGDLVGTGFGAAALLVAGYGSLAVLVMLLAEARARGLAVSYLRTLGLSRRQAHGLAVAEVVPVLLAASVTGWVLGLVLPSVLGPALDLRAYTGGSPVTHYVPDLSSTLALTGGLLVFAGLAVLIDAVTGARRGLGGVLRIGDT